MALNGVTPRLRRPKRASATAIPWALATSASKETTGSSGPDGASDTSGSGGPKGLGDSKGSGNDMAPGTPMAPAVVALQRHHGLKRRHGLRQHHRLQRRQRLRGLQRHWASAAMMGMHRMPSGFEERLSLPRSSLGGVVRPSLAPPGGQCRENSG